MVTKSNLPTTYAKPFTMAAQTFSYQALAEGTDIMFAKLPANIINKFITSVKMIEIIGLSVRVEMNIPIAISAAPKSIMPISVYM